MKGINSAFFVGAVAATPELRYTAGGTAILELTLAGKSEVQGKDEVKHLSFYQRTKAFGKFAEALAEGLSQGDALTVNGRMDFRSWEGEKSKRSAVELVIETINTLDAEGFTFDKDARSQPRLNEGVNEVTLAGNLTKDAELRYTPSGDAVAHFSIAVNERVGKEDRVGFYDVEVWRELAERYGSLSKGAGIIATGRIVNDSFEGRDGKVFTTTLEATRLYVVAGRSEGRQAPPPVKEAAIQPKADLPF